MDISGPMARDEAMCPHLMGGVEGLAIDADLPGLERPLEARRERQFGAQIGLAVGKLVSPNFGVCLLPLKGGTLPFELSSR